MLSYAIKYPKVRTCVYVADEGLDALLKSRIKKFWLFFKLKNLYCFYEYIIIIMLNKYLLKSLKTFQKIICCNE